MVEALINFMVCLYSPSELWELIVSIYQEGLATPLPIPNFAKTAVATLIREAQALDSMERPDDAIAIYEQVERGLGANDDIDVNQQAATALFNKAVLLNRTGRYTEAIRECDQLVVRFGVFREPLMRILTINALDHKGMALAKTGNASEAINAYDQALVLLAAFPLPELGFLVSGITQRKGLALIQNQNPSEAVAAFDRIVTRFRENKDLSAAGVVSALISKAIVLHQIESTLSEDDFLLLLECMAQEDKLRPGFMEVLAQVVSRLGPFKALELIQASPAAPLFLPLVTALQREIGQETHVAREIDEVAEDIRQLLERLRHDPQIGRTFLPDELTIRTTSTST